MDENVSSTVEEPVAAPAATYDQPRKKKTVLYALIGLALLVIIIIVVAVSSLQSKKSETKIQPKHINSQPSISPQNSKVVRKTFPKPAFKTWSGGTTPPVNYVAETQIFNLKTNLKSSDARAIASKFGLPGEPIVNKSNVVIKNETTQGEVNRLIFNLKSGTFTYVSTVGTALNEKGLNTAEKVETFIKSMFPNDTTLAFHSTYKRKSTGNDLTYYVMYRDWNKTSSKKMPIFSPFGLLNLTEANYLSSLNINSTMSLPIDKDVYATSDRTDGYGRADQFNAITIAVLTKNGEEKIQSVTSTIRPTTTAVAKLGKVISYEQAVENLKNNKSEIFFITPSDKSATSWDAVFPDNVARADIGEIQESYMAYLEYPPFMNQSQIKPYFIFKGQAFLKSGFSTRFIAAVPALGKSGGMSLSPSFNLVGNVFAQSAPSPTPDGNCQGTQCQGTYQVTPAPTAAACGVGVTCPSVTPPSQQQVTNPPIPTKPPSTSKCIPAAEDLMYMLHPDTGLWNPPAGDNYWYYAPDPNNPPTQEQVNEAMSNLINPDRKTPEQVFQEAQTSDCPIKAAFHTPSIFVYGPLGKTFTITPSSVVGAIPRFNLGFGWTFTVTGNGNIEVNNVPSQYLYYEYEKVSFVKPHNGWLIKKSELPAFVKMLSDDLQLTSKEKERVAYELAASTNKIDQENLYIGLIPQSEINSKLPLKISPQQSSLRRLHFYVSSAESKPQQITMPNLAPIKRSGTAIFEVGSYTN